MLSLFTSLLLELEMESQKVIITLNEYEELSIISIDMRKGSSDLLHSKVEKGSGNEEENIINIT